MSVTVEGVLREGCYGFTPVGMHGAPWLILVAVLLCRVATRS